MATLSWNGIRYNSVEEFCTQAGITEQDDINRFILELNKTKSVDRALGAVYSKSGMKFSEENYNGYDRNLEYLEKGRIIHSNNLYRTSLEPNGDILTHIRAVRTAVLKHADRFGITDEQIKDAKKEANEIIPILEKSSLFRDLKAVFRFTTTDLIRELWENDFNVTETWLVNTAKAINSREKDSRLQPIRYYKLVNIVKKHKIPIGKTDLIKFVQLDKLYTVNLNKLSTKLAKQILGDSYEGCFDSKRNQEGYTVLGLLYEYFDSNVSKLHIDMNKAIKFYMTKGEQYHSELAYMLYELDVFEFKSILVDMSSSSVAYRALYMHSIDIANALLYAIYLKVEERKHARNKRSVS